MNQGLVARATGPFSCPSVARRDAQKMSPPSEPSGRLGEWRSSALKKSISVCIGASVKRRGILRACGALISPRDLTALLGGHRMYVSSCDTEVQQCGLQRKDDRTDEARRSWRPAVESARRVMSRGENVRSLSCFLRWVRRRSKPVPFGEIAYPEAHRQSPQRFSGSRVEMRTAARR